MDYNCQLQGRIQDFGKGGGGSDKYIHNWGGGGGGGGARIASPMGSGASPQPLFCFCVDLAWISNTYTSRDIQITRACMNGDEKTLHSSQCYGSYCSAAAIKLL